MQAFNQNHYDAVALSYGNGGSPRSVISSNTSNGMNYSNGPIYPHGGDDISAEVEHILALFVEDAKRDLVGLALDIATILFAFWRPKGAMGSTIEPMLIALGICAVASKTKIDWELEETNILARYTKEDLETRKDEIRANEISEIFKREAMLYFTQEWVGKMIENMKSSSKWGLVASLGAEAFIELLRRDEPIVTREDIEEWAECIKANLLFK